jgi:hypothetical protein
MPGRCALLVALICWSSMIGCGDREPIVESSLDGGGGDRSDTDAGIGPVDSARPGDVDSGSGGASSGGSGGLSCLRTGDVGGGRAYCEVRIGSVDVRFVEPIGGDEGAPLRLALYLHGDGARAYQSNSVLRTLLPWADTHHALLAAVLAPNGCAWWQSPEHDCDGAEVDPDRAHENAAALDAALVRLRAAYDLRDAPILYYGSSGGSVFLTASFVPRYGDRYPGVLAINCGGEVPWEPGFRWTVTASSASELFFTYGDADFLREDAHAAVIAYQDLGFMVRETVLSPGVEHCAFDAHARAAEVWTEALAGE